ncbi:hypothetical protein EW026_g2587 [Hermanssonia centrifuga]|uniref:DUF1776-domain-containing protein n=1 Tax=Hermanssonia centrifuga TaxID=98765 RepID=A0A4S4KNT0_9APHY|nr:hypothetical protein EW026_g2587 [Hermanssonia centrifuga]
MPVPLPTVENIEEYLQHVEEVVVATVIAAAPDLPNVKQAFQNFWEDINRFGPWKSMPSFPEMKKATLGAFEVPPPPPPPPVPKGFMERSADWVGAHPWKTASIATGIVGAGLLIGYGGLRYRGVVKSKKLRAAASMGASTERRQVVVVLGGDSPLGLPLILDLEKEGYIVITSVSTPEAVDDIEKRSHGYVRAIVLDPSEPDTISYFLRSLTSTMSRRFPITASGDPHASPSSQSYIYSIISLLTLPSSDLTPPSGPMENLGMRDLYPAYLQATHFTPIQVFQALLPLLRNSPARTRDDISGGKGKRSIVVCLPATDARVGMPFAGAQAMSAAATLRGIEVLRREIRIAGLSDEAMKNIKVVVVDVGTVGVSPPSTSHYAMLDWTASEKAAYGSAFSSIAESGGHSGLKGRKPTDVSKFVETVVDVVSNGRKLHGHISEVQLVLGRIREWLRGDRVIVGAGARTYALASTLPPLVLDSLLNLPHFLLSIRNALLPVPPRVVLPSTPAPSTAQRQPLTGYSSAESDPEGPHDISEAGSEADVESNEGGYGSGVSESWISLNRDSPEHV